VILLVSGMIGLGKSSICELLKEMYGYEVIQESVEDNPILPFLYTATPEEQVKERYPFLLQLWFLQDRFEAMRKALAEGNKILDRSIYEDKYFAEKFLTQGKINQNEFTIYRKLLTSCMSVIDSDNKKERRVMIYLKGSFETVIQRIKTRGRLYEIDDELIDYYYSIWKDYDRFILSNETNIETIIIDTDKYDFVNNLADREAVMEIIKKGIGE